MKIAAHVTSGGRAAGAVRLFCAALLALGALLAPGAAADTAPRQLDAALRPKPTATPRRAPTPTRALAPNTDLFLQDLPIWSHTGPAAPHEVALFRRAFTLAEPLSAPTLELFADTRYEVWLDGAWVGRGPARFSRQTREYDVYPLGQLAAGPHLIAVLVQWAPNTRRSESTIPFLQGHLAGTAAAGSIVVRTGADWKTTRSTAWREDAALVHSWGLLGPTELLDMRRLPWNWNQPAFSDTAWAAAALAAPPAARYQPRSIATLANVAIPATVGEVGLLSPGRAVVELASQAGRASLSISAVAKTTLTIEALADPASSATPAAKVDGVALSWQARAERPDVLVSARPIAAGTHTLTFSGAPTSGVTFGVGTQGIDASRLPFQQGSHAGRRLLLAEPVRQADAVTVGYRNGVDLAFVRAPAYAVLDLGRVVHGRVVASVSGPAGTVVDIGWDERLWMGRRPLPYPGSLHDAWNQTDSWVLDGATRSISTIDARAGRYLLIAVWGPGQVRLSGLRVFEERYVEAQRGRFSSGDSKIDQIWQIGVNTLYPNMTDAYADPWRERGQWWGDAYVDDHVNRAAFGDADLLRRGVAQMAESLTEGQPTALAPNGSGTYLLDYSMLWVQSANDYVRRTGDTRLPAQIYPAMLSFMAYLQQRENATTGLLDVPYGDWWRTALVDWPVVFDRYGQSTALNALYYGTLRDAADLAEAQGDTARASAWRQRAAILRVAINTYLYQANQGRYIASIFNGLPRAASAQAQAWALAYDVVPDGERARVADSLLALLPPDLAAPNVEIYGMFWVLEGLGRAGRIGEASSVVRRYYGNLIERGATTWWEIFNADRSYTTSLSHGWGGAPTWFLTTYVLGARQTGPRAWSIRPGVGGASAASGALPLGQGSLTLEWAASCEQMTIQLGAPADTQGEVVLPLGNETTTITLDGVEVWQNGWPLSPDVSRQADGIRISLPGGPHALKLLQQCKTTYLPLTWHEE